jgi:hypothetical protein
MYLSRVDISDGLRACDPLHRQTMVSKNPLWLCFQNAHGVPLIRLVDV